MKAAASQPFHVNGGRIIKKRGKMILEDIPAEEVKKEVDPGEKHANNSMSNRGGSKARLVFSLIPFLLFFYHVLESLKREIPKIYSKKTKWSDEILGLMRRLGKGELDCYRPHPLFAASGHLATLTGYFRKPAKIHFPFTREMVTMFDGGVFALDFYSSCSCSGPSSSPEEEIVKGKKLVKGKEKRKDDRKTERNKTENIALLIHGVNGHSNEPYMKYMANILLESNEKKDSSCIWDVALMTMRGCAELQLESMVTYNGAWTEDVKYALHLIKNRFPQKNLYVVGFSLGGNLMIKAIAEECQEWQETYRNSIERIEGKERKQRKEGKEGKERKEEKEGNEKREGMESSHQFTSRRISTSSPNGDNGITEEQKYEQEPEQEENFLTSNKPWIAGAVSISNPLAFHNHIPSLHNPPNQFHSMNIYSRLVAFELTNFVKRHRQSLATFYNKIKNINYRSSNNSNNDSSNNRSDSTNSNRMNTPPPSLPEELDKVISSPNVKLLKGNNIFPSLKEVDTQITAHYWGYPTLDDYLIDASSADYLPTVTIPLLCIQAKDDPLVSESAINYSIAQAAKNNQDNKTIFVVTESGGHLGFSQSYDSPWSLNWAEKVAFQFLSAVSIHSESYDDSRHKETEEEKLQLHYSHLGQHRGQTQPPVGKADGIIDQGQRRLSLPISAKL